MIRGLRKLSSKKFRDILNFQRRCFMTNDYACEKSWQEQTASPILNNINLNDFYSVMDQQYSSKGVISAVDVDLFANALKDSTYLEELKNILHKLRMSADTGNTLDSTHHATIRNFMKFGNIEELIDILKDPLNFGIFLDHYSANLLLNHLLSSNKYDQAAEIASLVMLQEDFSNDITCSLCQYASYKYIVTHKPKEVVVEQEKPKKVEEIKIRVKFLINPYYDDHFDIPDTLTKAGKTLTWISEKSASNLNDNLKIIGLLLYKKYDKLIEHCDLLSKHTSMELHNEVLDILNKNIEISDADVKSKLEICVSKLKEISLSDTPLEITLKNNIENAINRCQNNDIADQTKLFKSWAEIRQQKLDEQIARLQRVQRIQKIEQIQKQAEVQEQKLWFFDNEEKIDLQIEEKEKLHPKVTKSTTSTKNDDDYIPPEIIPKRR